MIFQAVTDEEVRIIATEVEGSEHDRYSGQSVVPMLIERHSCAGGEARHVVFFDGHAELVQDEQWNNFIEPYLDVAREMGRPF